MKKLYTALFVFFFSIVQILQCFGQCISTGGAVAVSIYPEQIGDTVEIYNVESANFCYPHDSLEYFWIYRTSPYELNTQIDINVDGLGLTMTTNYLWVRRCVRVHGFNQNLVLESDPILIDLCGDVVYQSEVLTEYVFVDTCSTQNNTVFQHSLLPDTIYTEFPSEYCGIEVTPFAYEVSDSVYYSQIVSALPCPQVLTDTVFVEPDCTIQSDTFYTQVNYEVCDYEFHNLYVYGSESDSSLVVIAFPLPCVQVDTLLLTDTVFIPQIDSFYLDIRDSLISPQIEYVNCEEEYNIDISEGVVCQARISPNPSDGNFTVEMEIAQQIGRADFFLVNEQGSILEEKTVLNFSYYAWQINRADLASGTYYIRCLFSVEGRRVNASFPVLII